MRVVARLVTLAVFAPIVAVAADPSSSSEARCREIADSIEARSSATLIRSTTEVVELTTAILRDTRAADPRRPELLARMANAYCELAGLLRKQRPSDAEKAARSGARVLDQLRKEQPSYPLVSSMESGAPAETPPAPAPTPSATPTTEAATPAPEPRQEPPTEDRSVLPAARIAREQALHASRSGLWNEALASADETIRLAPDWPDAYFSRAAVRTGAAGDASKLQALQSVDDKTDYAQLAQLLEGATEDLERYLALRAVEPTAAERSAIADLRLRASLARKNIGLARELQAVVFEAAPGDGGAFRIAVETGGKTHTCDSPVKRESPCTLYLEPGRAVVQIRGSARLERQTSIPRGRTTVRLPSDDRHRMGVCGGGLLLGGIGLGAAGLTTDNEVARILGLVYGAVGVGVGSGLVISDGIRTRGKMTGLSGSRSEAGERQIVVGVAPRENGAAFAVGVRF